jgi:predicted MFS family arabinose efflux permease
MIQAAHTTESEPARVAAALLVGTLGVAVLLMLPALLAALTRTYGFEEKQLGLFSFADLGGLTLGAGLGARILLEVGIRRGTQWGLMVASLANFVSAAVATFWPLLVLRAVAGLGAGVVVAACYLVLGQSSRVDRHFSFYLLSQGVFGAISLKLLPSLSALIGTRGIFASLAALCALALLITSFLPTAQSLATPQRQRVRFSSAAWTGLAAVVAFFVAQGGVWAYLELIGTRGGVDSSEVAAGLALSPLVGLAGPLIAALVGARWGRALPLCIGLALTLASLALLSSHLDAGRFAFAACLFNVAWNYTLPYQLSALSAADATGTAVAWAASASLAGLAVGPPIAAFAHEMQGFVGVLGLSAALCALSVSGFIPALAKKLPTAASTG